MATDCVPHQVMGLHLGSPQRRLDSPQRLEPCADLDRSRLISTDLGRSRLGRSDAHALQLARLTSVVALPAPPERVALTHQFRSPLAERVLERPLNLIWASPCMHVLTTAPSLLPYRCSSDPMRRRRLRRACSRALHPTRRTSLAASRTTTASRATRTRRPSPTVTTMTTTTTTTLVALRLARHHTRGRRPPMSHVAPRRRSRRRSPSPAAGQ